MISPVEAVREYRRRARRSWDLQRLSRDGNRVTGAIARSIRAVLRREVASEEQRWVDRIEHLRALMNASTTQIVRADYGAGNPHSNLTPEERLAGVEVTDTLGHISQVATRRPFWCLLLFKLVRAMQPVSCVELGTALGVSAAYQAAALTLNGHGSLVTLEGAASLAEIARDNFQQLDLTNVEVVVGRFEDTLTDVLKARQPVDYVFVDGHHDERATLGYFEEAFPFLAESALLVFDDIAWSEGMRRAWNTLAQDRRVAVTIDLASIGLCVVDRSVAERRHVNIPLRKESYQ